MANSKENKSNFVKDGKFYILGKFDETIGQNILPPLIKHIDDNENKKDNQTPIEFIINSNGGLTLELYALLAEIERAKKANITVKTKVLGRAHSCGSMLAISGTKGCREMSYLADNLPHYGYAGNFIHGTPTDQKRENERKIRQFNKMLSIYKKYSDPKHHETIETNMEHDNWFISAEEAVKYGLADTII